MKGQIITRQSVSIHCAQCDRVDELEAEPGIQASNAEARRKGWKLVISAGWICPDCAKEQAA